MSKEIESLSIEVWSIENIKPYELNSKKHDKAQVDKIAESIAESGWDQPIVVDKDGVVIKGHGRRLAALKLGLKKVPVICRRDLSPEMVRFARLADNRVAISGIDTDLLKEELSTLDIDMSGIYDEKELEVLLKADMSEVDETAFVDVQSLLEEVSADAANAEPTTDENVPIAKAIGFKNVGKKDEKYVAGFVAILEEQFNKPAAEAFVLFAKQMVKEVKK